MNNIPRLPDLVREFTVGMTGSDCTASAVWFYELIQHGGIDPELKRCIDRACAHWEACTENEQLAIGPFFGLGEPHNERWPFAQVIKKDYENFLMFCTTVFDDEPYGG